MIELLQFGILIKIEKVLITFLEKLLKIFPKKSELVTLNVVFSDENLEYLSHCVCTKDFKKLLHTRHISELKNLNSHMNISHEKKMLNLVNLKTTSSIQRSLT